MLHGIMNELGNFLGSMFSYQSIASGALVLVITVIADNKPME